MKNVSLNFAVVCATAIQRMAMHFQIKESVLRHPSRRWRL